MADMGVDGQDGAVDPGASAGDNPFDMLVGEEIAQLEQAAAQALAVGEIEDPAAAAGGEEAGETAEDEANESPELQDEEAAAGTEAPGDLASLGAAAQAFADDCAGMQDEADKLIESAQVTLAMDDTAEGIDVDAAQEAADEIAEPMQACQDAADDAQKAVATEDINAASDAYKAAKEAHGVADEAMGRVREACGGAPVVTADEETPPPSTKPDAPDPKKVVPAAKPAAGKGKPAGAKGGWGGWADGVLG